MNSMNSVFDGLFFSMNFFDELFFKNSAFAIRFFVFFYLSITFSILAHFYSFREQVNYVNLPVV